MSIDPSVATSTDQFSKNLPPSTWDDQPQVGAYFSRDKNNSCSCGSCSWFDQSTSCNNNDFAVDWEACCGGLCRQTLKCLPPQEKVCSVSQTNVEFVKASWSSSNPNDVSKTPDLVCTYDKTKFTPESLVAYRKKFGKDSKYFEILAILASRPATEKCLNPVCQTSQDGSTMTCSSKDVASKCSSLSEDSHNGFLLRRELGFCSDAEKMDIVKTVCGRTADFDDCRCFNKLIVDSNYALLKKIHNYDDRCWYLPCVDSYSLSNYIQSNDIPTSCPNNMCQVIIDAARNQNVDISKIENTLNCSFAERKQVLPPPTLPSSSASPDSQQSNVGKYIVFGSAGVFVFLFVLFLINFASSSSSS